MTALYGWTAVAVIAFYAPRLARVIRDFEHRNETRWQRENDALGRCVDRVNGDWG